MFRDILVPLDGSEIAEAALPLASRLARLAEARLHLLFAHEPVAAVVGMGDMLPPPLELDEDRKERERAYLIKETAKLRQAVGRPVGFRVTVGSPGPEICEEASRLPADLVVMATHGRGTFRRIWLGSVADYVVRHLTTPILLVTPGREKEQVLDRPLGGILVALDLSQDAEAILESVSLLAQLTKAPVTLMHVVEIIFEVGNLTTPSPIVQDSVLLEASRVEAARQLERIADRLRGQGLEVTTRTVTGINAAGGLLDALSEDRYELIALTTHGRGGLRRLLLGSVADKVIRNAGKPVLVLRPVTGVKTED